MFPGDQRQQEFSNYAQGSPKDSTSSHQNSRNNKELKADKEIAIVVMNITDYKQKTYDVKIIVTNLSKPNQTTQSDNPTSDPTRYPGGLPIKNLSFEA